MEVLTSEKEMGARVDALRAAGRTIALVPTMGFLHEGHLELMRAGKQNADELIISIFVNPTQFGPGEDLDRYPRDTEGDLQKARGVGVDMVFIPSADEMYPPHFQTRIQVKDLPQHLCGLSRPGHFDGVATVVAKLFNITKPHIAIFGQKDYQQLAVISRMVMDLNMDIRIIGVPTVREPDGLAMSSRNKYLSSAQRPHALLLSRSLEAAEKAVKQGETDAGKIRELASDILAAGPEEMRVDYLSLCDPDTLDEVAVIHGPTLMAMAVWLGKTRLIDNRLLVL